jgi:solute carrier family 41
MCLSARLGTSANIGELDKKKTRHALLFANLSLLQLQALLISSVAAFLSFLLGLLTTHRIGDAPPAPPNALAGYSGIPIGDVDYQEGYTRPGWKQLMMVLATGMGAASLSSAVLGSFMSSLIVCCRWIGVDPGELSLPGGTDVRQRDCTSCCMSW